VRKSEKWWQWLMEISERYLFEDYFVHFSFRLGFVLNHEKILCLLI